MLTQQGRWLELGSDSDYLLSKYEFTRKLVFFSLPGVGGGLFFSPICLPLIPGEGMCDAERDRLQTDGGRVSV